MTTLSFSSKEERDKQISEFKERGIEVFGVGHSPFTETFSFSYVEEENNE